MGVANTILCEVYGVPENETYCLGSSKMRKGDKFIVGLKTPEGICAKAFAALYPTIAAMRFSDEIQWDKGRGYCDVVCPDGRATFRLTRIKEE